MKTTVQDVIDQLVKPDDQSGETVDRLLAGRPEMEVTGIAAAFMATEPVIEQAIARGINLIISHEGIYFSHHDNVQRLKGDAVYEQKKSRIEQSGIAIYRFHDFAHRYLPDGITLGLLDHLGWTAYAEEHEPAASIVALPAVTLEQLAAHVKQKLDIPYVRIVGNPTQLCKRVGVLVGYRGGGDNVIPLITSQQLDLVIYGEGPEWEAPAYVWDAISQGSSAGLMIVGHGASEEPGMQRLADRLQVTFPQVPVCYIPTKQNFLVL